MATLPGRCINDMYCSLASSGEIVRVPAEGKYVCPQCGKTLVPPNAPFRGRRRKRGRQEILGLLLVVVGFVGGMAIGEVFVWTPASNIVQLSEKLLTPGSSGGKAAELLQPQPLTVSIGNHAGGRKHRHGE